MILTRTKLAAACVLAAAAVALMASAPHPDQELRVCADPFDLPFSNEQEQGFENKIAHVVAQDLNARVVNYWWPSRRGVLRNSILGGFCDVMIQAPVGLDPVATTKPYYRSTYYFVYRADRGFALRSLDDIIKAVAKDSIDVAIVWGPLAGYWVKRQSVPLTMVALPDTDAVSGMPFAFDMAMAVRHRDKALKATLDSVIDRRRAEITAILDEYSVPMIQMHP